MIMTKRKEEEPSVAKSALDEFHEAEERGELEGIPLVEISARVFQRDGIQIPLSKNKFNVSSVQEQLRTLVRNAVGRPDEITHISAMCVPHRVVGKSTFFRAPIYRFTDSDVDLKYGIALNQISTHLNDTNGEGCQVFLKVDAPPPANIGGHGL